MSKAKALLLLSGGLDSMLVAKVLMEQGVEVIGLSFKSYFFNTAKAKKVAEQLGIKLIEVDFSEEHLKMVKNPVYGYGKNMNPCIDCHGLMLRQAGEFSTPSQTSPAHTSRERRVISRTTVYSHDKLGASKRSNIGRDYDFVATGEVLGQRPMSQNKNSLKIVEKISGLKGKILRPLSAKLLDETEAEKIGKINRNKLLAISGRSRKIQLALAKKYKLSGFSSPAGGCLLTDRVFCEKLFKMQENWPDFNGKDIELLKYGRICWLKFKKYPVLLVIGRNENENKELIKATGKNDIIMELADLAGPTAIIKTKYKKPPLKTNPLLAEKIKNKDLELKIPNFLKPINAISERSFDKLVLEAARLTGYYAPKARGKKVKFKISSL